MSYLGSKAMLAGEIEEIFGTLGRHEDIATKIQSGLWLIIQLRQQKEQIEHDLQGAIDTLHDEGMPSVYINGMVRALEFIKTGSL